MASISQHDRLYMIAVSADQKCQGLDSTSQHQIHCYAAMDQQWTKAAQEQDMVQK